MRGPQREADCGAVNRATTNRAEAAPAQLVVRRCTAAFGLCCALAAAAAGAPAPNRVDTGQRMANLERDPRLARPVSFSAYRMHLGELLELVSAKTGVALRTDERIAPLSGYELTLVVHDRPAWEVLDGVRRLYLAGRDRWHWTAESRSGVMRYVLQNTAPPSAWAQQRQGLLRSLMLEEFRQKKAAAIGRADTSGPYALNAPFLTRLAENDVHAILDGRSLSIPAGHLTGEQRAAIESGFARHNELLRQFAPAQEGAGAPRELHIADVDGVVISLAELGRSGLPVLQVQAATLRSGLLGGYGLLPLLQQRAAQDWLAKDEELQAPDQPVPAEGEAAQPAQPALPGSNSPTLDRYLERLGRLGRLNLIYDRPVVGLALFYINSKASTEGRLPEILKQLARENLAWKHKKPFLYFRLGDWMGNPRHALVPWPVIRELRATSKANNGYLRPDDWTRLAALAPEQREHLATEFPDARQITQRQGLAALLLLRAAMSPEERTALAGPKGSGWGDWQLRTQRRAVDLFGLQQAQGIWAVLRWNTERPAPLLLFAIGSGEPPERLETVMAARCRLDPNTLFPVTAAPAPGGVPAR